MHVEITGLRRLDHKNGNGLDNRRENLRRATATQNAQNRKVGKNNLLGLKGVQQLRPNSFTARIRVNKKLIVIGCFKTAEEASKARSQAEVKYFGEFARIK